MASYTAPESLHVGTGVETVFGFGWPYLLPTDLLVTLNGVAVTTVLASPNQVAISPAPAAGVIIRIYRNTPAQNPTYLFASGIPMLPRYIDGNNKQLLYALQEGLLQFAQTQATANEALVRAAAAEVSAAAAQASAAQQARDIRKTLRVSPAEPDIPTLPPVALRANKVMGFDSLGNPVGTIPASGSGVELAIDLADPTKGGYLVGVRMLGPYAGETSVSDKIQKMPDVTDYLNANGSFVSTTQPDNLSGIQRAIDANAGKPLTWGPGNFKVEGTLSLASSPSMRGAGRLLTSILNTSGDAIPTILIDGPDAGVFEDIGFWTSANTGPAIRFTNTAHMWSVNRLLFRATQGPCIQVDTNTWDAFFNDIDILSCARDGTLDPSVGAAVIVKDAVNNLHFRGLRIERPKNAGIYWAGQGFISGGKIDRGFDSAPTQPGLIVPGRLVTRDYLHAGSNNSQPPIRVTGAGELLAFGGSVEGGIIGIDGLVSLALTRTHSITDPRSLSFRGPVSGGVKFIGTHFTGKHVSTSPVVPGVVAGKVASNIYIGNSPVASRNYNSATNYTSVFLTGVSYPTNSWADGCTLVHATTGKRYFIRLSYLTGELRIYGGDYRTELAVGDQCRIEYMPAEEDQVSFDSCTFSTEVQPYFYPATKLTLSGVSYNASTGMTTANMSGATAGLEGYFLVARATGVRHKIFTHGGGVITLPSDLTAELVGTAGAYDVMSTGGYDVQVRGSAAEWVHKRKWRQVELSTLRESFRSADSIYIKQDGVEL